MNLIQDKTVQESAVRLDFLNQASAAVIESGRETTRITNGRFLRDGKIEDGDLWVRDGKILDAERYFYDRVHYHEVSATKVIDAKGMIVAAGFIDIHIGGAYGINFSNTSITESDIDLVLRRLVSTGCTSIYPTLVTSSPADYRKLLPLYSPRKGSVTGGTGILGVHMEGPFISMDRSGVHKKECIQSAFHGVDSLLKCYGCLDNIRLVTLAPELEGAKEAIQYLHSKGIVVAIGHTASHIEDAINGVNAGAAVITHIFNAMSPFHHRDPGVIGILGIPDAEAPYFSVVADDAQLHPFAVRVVEKAHGDKCVLISNGSAVTGLPDGDYTFDEKELHIVNKKVDVVEGDEPTGTSTVTLDECVRNYRAYTGCTTEEAICCVTRNPARLMNVDYLKGDLLPNMDADFVFLDDDLNVHATFIGGELAWHSDSFLL